MERFAGLKKRYGGTSNLTPEGPQGLLKSMIRKEKLKPFKPDIEKQAKLPKIKKV